MKKIFILIGFLIFFFSLGERALAAGTCSWEILTTSSSGSGTGGGSTSVSGGCDGKKLTKSDSSKCKNIKEPKYSAVWKQSLECCCPATITKEEEEKPTIFEMADLQVKIPGMKELADVTCLPDTDCEIPWLGEYIKGIYNYLIAIVGIIAALVLMAGGVLWLVSRGEASNITQAKNLILGSITGILILATSYLVLLQLNPNLVNLKNLSLRPVKKMELKLAEAYLGQTSQSYKTATCASAEELKTGVSFYATGYYKPKWENTEKFRCVIAMQCTCPNGQDTSKNCDFLYGKLYPGYHPCKEFAQTVPYCNMTKSLVAPKDGDIAGPDNCLSTLPRGTKVCFNGKTYTITDSGGGIKGRRIDIWSGDSLDKALSSTGVGKLTIGACK